MALNDVATVLSALSKKLSVDLPMPPEKEARVRQLARELQDLIDPDSRVKIRITEHEP
jgi:hypothetical protein